ncbi:MAG: hypothetical protein R2785_10830 [Flavobacteriaceae bacterium]
MGSKNRIKPYRESNSLGLLAIILSIGFYFRAEQKDFWNTLPIVVNYSQTYSLVILMLGIVSLAFWFMSLGYIFLTFFDYKNDLKNFKQNNFYRRSKHFLALSIVLLIISSLLYFNIGSLY